MTCDNEIRYFLLVKDVVNNKDCIFADQPVTKAELTQAFDLCFLQLKTVKQNLQMKNNDMYCECFETSSFLNKGWIWNSTEMKTQVCYVIRAIEVMTYSDAASLADTVIEDTQCTVTVARQPYVESRDVKSELVNELKCRLSQPNFGLKVRDDSIEGC